MAEGLAKTLLDSSRCNIKSAGSCPTRVHPLAVEAMKLAGVDISSHVSKSVSEIDVPACDFVITLCEEEACPALKTTARRVHWPLPDPAKATEDGEATLAAFINVRNMLREKLISFRLEWGLDGEHSHP